MRRRGRRAEKNRNNNRPLGKLRGNTYEKGCRSALGEASLTVPKPQKSAIFWGISRARGSAAQSGDFHLRRRRVKPDRGTPPIDRPMDRAAGALRFGQVGDQGQKGFRHSAHPFQPMRDHTSASDGLMSRTGRESFRQRHMRVFETCGRTSPPNRNRREPRGYTRGSVLQHRALVTLRRSPAGDSPRPVQRIEIRKRGGRGGKGGYLSQCAETVSGR